MSELPKNILMLKFECTSNELAETTAKLWIEMLGKGDPDAVLTVLTKEKK
jgi:hypothetical protein